MANALIDAVKAGIGVQAAAFALAAVGLNLQFGYSGLLNFGHVAFMAIGAYTMAILTVKAGLTLWASAAVAVAAAATLGVPLRVAASGVEGIDTVAGRYDVVEHEGRQVRLLLAKNPASWAEALEIASTADRPLVLAFNSDGVDGRDPSWLYDVPFGALTGRSVVVTGRRSTDLLVRLEMEGLTDVRVAGDLGSALHALPPGPVDLVANYTAFQQARRELSHGR
jgi:hypothetical protein